MCQAHIVGTGRDEAPIDPVVTEIALPGDVVVVVIGDGIIGAFGDAGLATGAAVGVHDHNTVLALVDGVIRTSVRTGGIVAVTAQVHPKAEFQLVINQPGAVFCNVYQLDSLRRPILLLAGHLARLTAPA